MERAGMGKSAWRPGRGDGAADDHATHSGRQRGAGCGKGGKVIGTGLRYAGGQMRTADILHVLIGNRIRRTGRCATDG
jgi:hypothetical protein